MTLNDIQGNSLPANLFKCDFLYSHCKQFTRLQFPLSPSAINELFMNYIDQCPYYDVHIGLLQFDEKN